MTTALLEKPASASLGETMPVTSSAAVQHSAMMSERTLLAIKATIVTAKISSVSTTCVMGSDRVNKNCMVIGMC